MTLRIRLLGELDLRLDGTLVGPLESARAESLLAYLLLHREAPQPRQHLAFLLWPDSTEEQARTNLRHVLHNLRRALPDPDRFLAVTPRTLGWRADAPFWLDVAAFEEAFARAERAGADGDLGALREAIDLYAGDLLAGCYDEWLLGERERLRRAYLGALERLVALFEARGELAEAIGYAERLLRHDPLHEATYRLLMRLHDARGDRARALRVYHVCAATLERELGIEPSPPTRQAYEALLPPEPESVAGQRPAGRAGGPPFVGRLPERARLQALWRAAEKGGAQFLLVTGEPGVGKTRLVEEFRSWCLHRGAQTAEARSYPAEGAFAYGPVVEWLRSVAIKPRLDRLDRAHLSELARLLPELLSEVPGLAHPEPLPENDLRARLFDALARAILAPGGPLLLVADDLQWCDRETLQFLHYLLRVAPDARLLVAATARREDIGLPHPLNDLLTGLRALERLTEIELGRLSRAETAALAERLAGRPLVEPDTERLYRETEGNPLFVVEALRAGWEGGPAERAWLSPKVQAVIESRLARLSEPARDLVGLAATIGREFTSDLLARASEADDEALVRGLDELWRRRLVREQGADAYDFSHDKIREVAYLGLSPPRRRQLHLRVARALEALHASDPGLVAGQLAAHYERAGAVDRAVTWYARAAEAARGLYANAEAVRLASHALELLHTLPETAERRQRELALVTALPAALQAVEGYRSIRLVEVQERALALARALGAEPEPPLLVSLALASLSRDQFAAAWGHGVELRARGERDSDAMLRAEGDYILGVTAFWQGEFEVARGHLEAAVEAVRPELRRAHLLEYGHDPQVVCLMRLACTLWFLGCPDAAIRARDAALRLADEIGHPYTRSVALVFGAVLSLEARDLERFRACAADLAAFAANGSRHNRLLVEAYQGYLDVLDRRTPTGVARVQRALDALFESEYGAPGQHVLIGRVLVEACSLAGDARAELAAAERALAISTAAHIWEAEFRRRRADSLAALGAPAVEVEAELGRALAVARRQGARSLELRAAASLLRHRLRRGDGPGVRAARDLLAGVIEGFREGWDTPDLCEATALLD